MRQAASFLIALCSSVALGALTAPARAAQANITENQQKIVDLLKKQEAALQRRQAEWLKAYGAFTRAREEAQTRHQELNDAKELFLALNRPQIEYGDFVLKEQARLDEAIAARDVALEKSKRAHAEFKSLFDQFAESLRDAPDIVADGFKPGPMEQLLSDTAGPRLVAGTDPQRSAPAPVDQAQTSFASQPPGAARPADFAPAAASDKNCDLTGPIEMAVRGPHNCKHVAGLRENNPGLPAMHFLFGDRSFNTQVISSAASTIAELKVSSDSFYPYTPWMARPTVDNFRRQPVALGWSLGFKSENGRILRRQHRDDDEAVETEVERVGYLDRLDASLTATVGFGFGIYEPETGKQFLTRAAEMRAAARAACLQDMQKSRPASPSTCEGDDLVEWIFAPQGRKYANPEQIKAFERLFYGTKYSRPLWGGGVQLEIGRPKISHFPFTLIQAPDPFDAGETKTVVDPANLPPEFLSNDPIEARPTATALTGYLFKHFRDSDPEDEDTFNHGGTTLIPSFTWKRDYAHPAGTKGVRICPNNDGAAVVTDQLCRTVNVARAERKDSYVGSVELRTIFDFPLLVPQVGLAPKFSWEFTDGRKSLAVPLLFALDSKGVLNGGLKYTLEFDGVNSAGKKIDAVSELAILVGASFDLHGNK